MVTRVFEKIQLAKRALREITLLRHFNNHENVRQFCAVRAVHLCRFTDCWLDRHGRVWPGFQGNVCGAAVPSQSRSAAESNNDTSLLFSYLFMEPMEGKDLGCR